MESRKMVLMNLLAVQKRRCRHKEQTVDTVGEGECGRPGCDPWVGKIPWKRAWQPTPVFLPGES